MIHIGLTFAEVDAGASVQQHFGQVVISHTDSTHERSPFKAKPGLHIHACSFKKVHIK